MLYLLWFCKITRKIALCVMKMVASLVTRRTVFSDIPRVLADAQLKSMVLRACLFPLNIQIVGELHDLGELWIAVTLARQRLPHNRAACPNRVADCCE
jgi:hypothetical protein